MQSIFTTIFLALVITSQASAQFDSASFASYYEKETVYFRGNGLLYNGVKVKPSSRLFDFSPAGLAEYRKSLRSTKRFYVSYAAAAGFLAGSIATRNERDAALLLTGSVVSLSLSFHFLGRSANQLNKSIWLRNRDTLKRRF